MKTLIEHIAENHKDVKSLTLYAMSKDNFEKRNPLEISNLWKMFSAEIDKLKTDSFQIHFIGDRTLYPKNILAKIVELENNQKPNDRRLNILLVYDGEDIKEDLDLVVRTGGYHRLSGMKISKNTTLFFTPKLFPEFSVEDFEDVLEWNKEQQKQNYGR